MTDKAPAAKPDWAIRLDTTPNMTDDQVDALVDELAKYSPAIGPDGAQLCGYGRSAITALSDAARDTRQAMHRLGVIDARVTGGEVKPYAVFLRDLEHPVLPTLMGLAEIAQAIGVTRQRAGQLAQREDFPEPAARLHTGPVWTDHAIERFLAGWERRRTGRPPKSVEVEGSTA